MNIKQRRLPQAYQEVEWIGSNADACLMTNYVPTVDTIVECEAYCENGNSIFGVFDDNAFRYNITGGSATSKTAYFPTSSSKTFAVTEGFHKFTYGKNLYCDDVLIHTFSGTFQLTTSLTLAIFARNNNNNHFQDRLKGKIKPLKIIENNSVQAFLIPCYRISDSVIGMYDTIGGTFYTNQGTGTFTKGADVVTLESMTIPEGNAIRINDGNGNLLWKKHLYDFKDLCDRLVALGESIGTDENGRYVTCTGSNMSGKGVIISLDYTKTYAFYVKGYNVGQGESVEGYTNLWIYRRTTGYNFMCSMVGNNFQEDNVLGISGVWATSKARIYDFYVDEVS